MKMKQDDTGVTFYSAPVPTCRYCGCRMEMIIATERKSDGNRYAYHKYKCEHCGAESPPKFSVMDAYYAAVHGKGCRALSWDELVNIKHPTVLWMEHRFDGLGSYDFGQWVMVCKGKLHYLQTKDAKPVDLLSRDSDEFVRDYGARCWKCWTGKPDDELRESDAWG